MNDTRRHSEGEGTEIPSPARMEARGPQASTAPQAGASVPPCWPHDIPTWYGLRDRRDDIRWI